MTTETTLQNLPFSPNLFAYRRRKTRVVMVGDVAVGGSNPLRIQSMTTTRTTDTDATVAQTVRLVKAGCEIVRITAPTELDAKNLKNIRAALHAKGIRVPLVADIHFRAEAAIEAAEHVEKVRINPGNYADSKAFKTLEYTDAEYQDELDRLEERFTPLVLKLKRLGRSLRIGTNHGSLSDRIMNRYGDSPEGMVESALEFVRICRRNDFHEIILSMKASNPKVMIAAYRLLAARMAEEDMDYPFHLGVTEAGDGEDGRIKSAIGIGSLLEDGIGDTIRVSLTEEPEFEIPVAKQIASRYDRVNQRINGQGEIGFFRRGLEPCSDLSHTENFFHYARRKTREVPVGPFRLGGEQVVRVTTNVSRLADAAGVPAILSSIQKALKSKSAVPELLEIRLKTPECLEGFRYLQNELRGERHRLGYLGRWEGTGLPPDAAWAAVDAMVFPIQNSDPVEAASAARSAGKTLFAESDDADDLLEWARRAAAEIAPNIVLSLSGEDVSKLIHQLRYVAAQKWVRYNGFPIHLRLFSKQSESDYLISASILLGSLLCDGIGDSVQVGLESDLEKDLRLAYNVLQGAGVRITKTEYVSCPSCGRTLFDLQSTTERIKSKTSHLKNVKIAIMGCIVNGPGEMADADFGYVGGGPGKINLYVGKDCVEKGIPTQEADGRLVELIKQHGKWTDPE